MLFTLLACGLVDTGVKTTTITDEGTVCVNADGDVQVHFPGCLSSSCDTLVSATCTAEIVDGVVEVHGEAVIESAGETCTDDCGYIMATCAWPEPEEATLISTMTYAGAEYSVSEACSF